MRWVFAGSAGSRVEGSTPIKQNIAAHRRLLRCVTRRPATAAAMTPGFWRLSVASGISPGITLGIGVCVLNRIARQWHPFQWRPFQWHPFSCGSIPYRCSWRTCRRRGTPATSPASATRLLGFAVLQ
jgi:hypothetical protein